MRSDSVASATVIFGYIRPQLGGAIKWSQNCSINFLHGIISKEKKQGRYVTCPKRTFIIFCSNRWPVSLGQKKYCRIFHFTAAATLCMYTHHTLAEHRNEFYKKLYYLHVDFKDFFSLFFRPARQKFQLCLHIIGRITLQAKVLLGKVCSSRNWFSEQDSVC